MSLPLLRWESYPHPPGNTAQTSAPWHEAAGPATGVGGGGDVKSVRAGLGQVRLRTRPHGSPPRPRGGPIAWPDTCQSRVGRAPPKPRPLCTQGIITFGEVKGFSPHPARPCGPGAVWRETPRPTPLCTSRHHTTMTVHSGTGSSLAQTIYRERPKPLFQDPDPMAFPQREHLPLSYIPNANFTLINFETGSH